MGLVGSDLPETLHTGSRPSNRVAPPASTFHKKHGFRTHLGHRHHLLAAMYRHYVPFGNESSRQKSCAKQQALLKPWNRHLQACHSDYECKTKSSGFGAKKQRGGAIRISWRWWRKSYECLLVNIMAWAIIKYKLTHKQIIVVPVKWVFNIRCLWSNFFVRTQSLLAGTGSNAVYGQDDPRVPPRVNDLWVKGFPRYSFDLDKPLKTTLYCLL